LSNIMVGVMLDQQLSLCRTCCGICILLMISQCLCNIFTFLHISMNSFIDTLLNSKDYKAVVGYGTWSKLYFTMFPKQLSQVSLFSRLEWLWQCQHAYYTWQTVFSEVSNNTGPDDFLAKARTHDMYRNVMAYLNLIIITAWSLWVLIKAAVVTDLCSKLPSLVNSFDFQAGIDIEQDRQYIVQYITHRSAGVYLKGVKLSAPAMIKAAYIFGAVVCTVGTSAMSGLCSTWWQESYVLTSFLGILLTRRRSTSIAHVFLMCDVQQLSHDFVAFVSLGMWFHMRLWRKSCRRKVGSLILPLLCGCKLFGLP